MTREESLAGMAAWMRSIRADLQQIQELLVPIANGWTFPLPGGQSVPMTTEQRQQLINTGVAVLTHMQNTVATLPDVSGLLND